MRKKFFRILLNFLKKWDEIVYYKYVNNLRIFKTSVVTFVLVNAWRQDKIYVYYFYIPKGLYLYYDVLEMYCFENQFHVLNYIKKEVKKIEDDEFHRLYRISRQESVGTEN